MIRRLPVVRTAVVLLCPLISVASATAQPGTTNLVPTTSQPNPQAPAPITNGEVAEQGKNWEFTLTVRGIAELESDFKGGVGTAAVYRAGMEFDGSYKFNDTISGGLNISTQASWFNFNNAQALTPGSPAPYGTFAQTTLAPSVTYTLDKNWRLTVGGLIDFSGEHDADIGDSFTGGGFFAASYKCSDKFRISFGFIGTSRIEDDFFVYPYLGIDWTITEKVSLKVYANQNGPEARITAKVAENWSFFFYTAYQARAYRLSDDSPIADGVFRERSLPAMFGATYKCCDNFEINGGVGVVAWRRFRQDTSDGIRIAQVETDPGAAFFLSCKLSF